MEDKLKRFLPDMKTIPGQTITMQAEHYTAFLESVEKELTQMRADMNEVFNAVASHIANLQNVPQQMPTLDVLPMRVHVAMESLKIATAKSVFVPFAESLILEYLIHGATPPADEERTGRTAADDDAARQGHIQAQVQSDELGSAGEVSPAETGDTRAPE